MPFFLTKTLHPAGELVNDTGYSDLERIEAQLAIKVTNGAISDSLIFMFVNVGVY
jgi:hypothetical protein